MCVLHVRSQTMSFQEFLKDTKLPVYQSHEKGEQRFKSRSDKPSHDDYGISCDVSKKEWDDLDGQIKDAIAFLSNYEEDILFLSQDYSIDSISLDFPYFCRISDNVLVQCDYLPPELLLKAGKLGIGIELSLYTDSGDDDSPFAED